MYYAIEQYINESIALCILNPISVWRCLVRLVSWQLLLLTNSLLYEEQRSLCVSRNRCLC
jgi:hypothetical protein